jgi:hypothetical protein
VSGLSWAVGCGGVWLVGVRLTSLNAARVDRLLT